MPVEDVKEPIVFEYYFNKSRLWALLGGMALLLLPALMIIVNNWNSWRTLWALPFLAFFFSLLPFCIRNLTGKDPALIIDKDGLIDRSNYLSIGRIKWTEIADIQVRAYGTLSIMVVDPEKFIALKGMGSRAMMRLNMRAGETPFNLSAQLLDASLEDLMEAISYFFQPPTTPKEEINIDLSDHLLED